ncbi:MAG TPA: hexitol phosphatase HxpB [Candidatus Saccharimonadia bacterium]|nr:hexitol phosphatase HxpB [Candidatus Saccharimonadia bacterium]
MVKAVIFDMDGLLIDSEPMWHRAERKCFGAVGIELSDEDLLQQTGTRLDEVVAYRYHEKPWQGPSQKDVEAAILDEVIKLIRADGEPRAGVIKTLDAIQAADIPMALASSSLTEVIDAVLDTLKLRKYFKYTHSAEHESHGKPHPAVFLSTADMLRVHPRDIVVFEDAPAGVLAAKAAKMACIAVPEPFHKGHKFVQTADLVLDSLEDFDTEMLASL